MQEKDRRVLVLNLNPPTEKSIMNVMQRIAVNENIRMPDRDFQEIKDQSNKDLRNAITTLQFKSAGRKLHESMFGCQPLKRIKSNSKKQKIVDESEDYDPSFASNS